MARPRKNPVPVTQPAEELPAETVEETSAELPSMENDVVGRLNSRLQEMEADPEINTVSQGRKRYLGASAYTMPDGQVRVQYYFPHGNQSLRGVEEAEKYLAWLEAGNVGTHFTMRRQEDSPQPAEEDRTEETEQVD